MQLHDTVIIPRRYLTVSVPRRRWTALGLLGHPASSGARRPRRADRVPSRAAARRVRAHAARRVAAQHDPGARDLDGGEPAADRGIARDVRRSGRDRVDRGDAEVGVAELALMTISGTPSRAAASSCSSDMIPPRASNIAPRLLPATSGAPAARPRPYTQSRRLARATSIRVAGQCSSAFALRRRTPGVPPRIELDSDGSAAAFHRCRSGTGADRGPADTWSSSTASARHVSAEAPAPCACESLLPTGLSTLGFSPARFQTEPPTRYPASWQLLGRDSLPLATLSLCWIRPSPSTTPNSVRARSGLYGYANFSRRCGTTPPGISRNAYGLLGSASVLVEMPATSARRPTATSPRLRHVAAAPIDETGCPPADE